MGVYNREVCCEKSYTASTKWKKKEEIVMIRAILLIAKKKLSPMTRNELLIE